MAIRPAIPGDYGTFARLFPELRVPHAAPPADKWRREMMPTTFVAERDGRPLGVAYWQVMRSTGYLSTLISDPSARRTGIGRELMTAVRDRLRDARCDEWRLNVFPGNAAAIALYESFGLRRAWRSRSLHFPWSILDRHPPSYETREVEPDDEAHVEHETGMILGLVAIARGKGRILRLIERGDQVTGAAAFDPTFPGAYPFRAKTIADAVSLLHALRPFAREADEGLSIATEDQEALADALVALGATVRVETMHMRGPLGEVR